MSGANSEVFFSNFFSFEFHQGADTIRPVQPKANEIPAAVSQQADTTKTQGRTQHLPSGQNQDTNSNRIKLQQQRPEIKINVPQLPPPATNLIQQVDTKPTAPKKTFVPRPLISELADSTSMAAENRQDSIITDIEPMLVYLNSREVWPGHLLPAKEFKTEARNYVNHDFFSAYLLLSLFLIGLVRFLYTRQTGMFFKTLLGTRFLNQFEKEGDFIFSWGGFLLFANSLFVFAGLVTTSLKEFQWINFENALEEKLLFLSIVGALAAFYIGKHLFIRFLGWVFKNKQAVITYQSNIFVYNQSLGVILLPFVALNVYYPSSFSFVFAWSLFLLLSAGKFLRGISIGISQSGFSAYYLILYLCAVEIAPLLVIFKAMALNFNI